MSNDHPITPPPELVRQWLDSDDFTFVTGTHDLLSITKDRLNNVIAQAARWGWKQCMELDAEWLEAKLQKARDEELDACCGWVINTRAYDMTPGALRAARRTKPPSLKEQSLVLIDKIQGNKEAWDIKDLNVVRRALEALDD